MAATVENLRAFALNITQLNDDILPVQTQQQNVYAAVERYSQDRPHDVTTDVTGDGGRYYGITASLSSWVEGFSRVLAIEYPADAIADDDVPVYLTAEDWDDDYWAGGTRYLFLPNHSPAATETMRIRYTVPHVASDGNYANVPTNDFYAIGHLVASMMCQSASIRYSKTTDSAIAADAIGHTTRSGEFAARARELEKIYLNHMELDKDQDLRPAGEFLNWDTDNMRRRYLFRGGPR